LFQNCSNETGVKTQNDYLLKYLNTVLTTSDVWILVLDDLMFKKIGRAKENDGT
jgi:hypothetical protein